MRLNELAELMTKDGLDFKLYMPEGTNAETDVDILMADSRHVKKNTLFACVIGEHSNGHDFAANALDSGASVLMCEHKLPLNVPQIICADVRRNMGIAAACLYGHPSEKLKMVAITGTTGKTTSTFMTKAVLEHAGIKSGLLGSVFYDDGKISEDADRTTPEADFIQLWLKNMVDNGCGACVMETSSHSIVQGRLEGSLYDAAGFTNLTVDHLDYHKTMDSYYAAKKVLFEKYMRGDWKACIYIDNEYGKRLYGELGERSISYSLKEPTADYYAEILDTTIKGMNVKFKTPDSSGMVDVHFPIIGSHNILNAMQAASIAHSLGIPASVSFEGLTSMQQVPGRLERYMIPGSGSCIIDFAHAPDGLEKVLTAVRLICKGKLVVAFGAGGDRDRSKRPIMGEIATRLADSVIITTDNPRTEEPEAITAEIEAGAKRHPTECRVIVDRREAIYYGLSNIGTDDIFVIAGKGPERYQLLKTGKIPFLDKNIMLDWCKENGKEAL